MATIKKQQKISVDRNVKKKKMEPLCTLGRSVVKWCSHFNNTAVSQTQSPRENNMAVSQTIKITRCSRSSSSSKSKSRVSKKYLHTHVKSSIIYHNQEGEATQVSIGGWMDKQNVVCVTHTHIGILFSLKKEESLTTATTWMNLQGIMLSNISQSPRDKDCMIPLT